MNGNNMQPTRMFGAQLRRTVHRECVQFANLQIEAASESKASEIAGRMSAAGDDEIIWVDGGDVDDDPEDATVDWVGEIDDEDAELTPESRTIVNARFLEMLDDMLMATGYSEIEQSRVMQAVERVLDGGDVEVEEEETRGGGE